MPSEEQEVPAFENSEEYLGWAFTQLSLAVQNLSSRIAIVESIIEHMPPRGANMIQYKIPGNEEYSNLKELLDIIFERLPAK